MKKLYITLLSVCIFFAILFCVFLCVAVNIKSKMPYERLCKNWQGDSDTRYSYISSYLNEANSINYEDFKFIDLAIGAKLTENAISPDEDASADARLYTYSYSGQKNLQVYCDKKSTPASAQGIFVDGDFFMLHPEQMLYGTYFNYDSVNRFSAVIDENLAWQLFGALDVCGLEVRVANNYYTVCGVAKAPTQKYSDMIYGTLPRIWLPYNYLDEQSMGISITCLEYILPNKIDGMALDIFNSASNFPKESSIVTENSERVKIPSLIKKLCLINTWLIPQNRIIPMYWENTLRICETKLCIVLFFEILCAIMFVIPLLALLSILWFTRKWRTKDIKNYITDKWDTFVEKAREKRYNRKLQKQNSDIQEENNNETQP